MKKMKQILAIGAIVIIIGLYISTLVLALSGFENWWNLLMAAIAASVMLPLIIWLFLQMASVFHKDDEDKS